MVITETKFTPGPWSISFDQIYALDQSNNPIVVAQVSNWNDLVSSAADANARLIAAAPELYEALTEARTTLSILRTQVMVEIGRCSDPSESRWEGVPEKLKDRLDAIDAALAKSGAVA